MFQKMMLNQMQKQAEQVVDKVIMIYKKEKGKNPSLPEVDLFIHTITIFYNIPEEKVTTALRDGLKEKCICLESVCYFCGFSSPIMKNAIILRSAQFLAMIDRQLESKGIPACSMENKLLSYEAVKMKDAFISNPEIFR